MTAVRPARQDNRAALCCPIADGHRGSTRRRHPAAQRQQDHRPDMASGRVDGVDAPRPAVSCRRLRSPRGLRRQPRGAPRQDGPVPRLEQLQVGEVGAAIMPPIQAELEEHASPPQTAQNGAGSSLPSPAKGSTASATTSKTSGAYPASHSNASVSCMVVSWPIRYGLIQGRRGVRAPRRPAMTMDALEWHQFSLTSKDRQAARHQSVPRTGVKNRRPRSPTAVPSFRR
jgi:hypothetical protein